MKAILFYSCCLLIALTSCSKENTSSTEPQPEVAFDTLEKRTFLLTDSSWLFSYYSSGSVFSEGHAAIADSLEIFLQLVDSPKYIIFRGDTIGNYDINYFTGEPVFSKTYTIGNLPLFLNIYTGTDSIAIKRTRYSFSKESKVTWVTGLRIY